jgi:hypothetical protein
MKSEDIADLDLIYLSYDEPLKEEFWAKIKNMAPWARRVDGVKGSDAAHKAAAAASTTERFVLIDGDNLPDPQFFNLTLQYPTEQHEQAVFRWRARNHINGLMYGNGGISSWTKTYVRDMRTHELAQGSETHTVDFCLDYKNSLYWAMHDCYSTTYPNGSAFQAWRAGFREGVKMVLNQGRRPTVADFKEQVNRRNMDNLTIWHNVGVDVEHGYWAIAGARQGTYMTVLTNWDHNQVQWFDNLAELWCTVESSDPRLLAGQVGIELHEQLGLPVAILPAEQSAFFKRHYRSDWHNRGVMIREIDVIRQQEGW